MTCGAGALVPPDVACWKRHQETLQMGLSSAESCGSLLSVKISMIYVPHHPEAFLLPG